MMSKIKICHLVSGKFSGGAARGALWLHQGLLQESVDSIILNDYADCFNYENVIQYPDKCGYNITRLIRAAADRLPGYFYTHEKNTVFSAGLFGVDFTRSEEYKNSDILHLHWVNNGFVNIKHLAKVEKPIIWTFRDMWPMTGGCHYSMGCDKYIYGCGKCPILRSDVMNDLSGFVLRRKIKYVPQKINIIGISDWLTKEAKKSLLYKDFNVLTISNCIDTDFFYPIFKNEARESLSIGHDKNIVLVGAQSLMGINKGFVDLLNEFDKVEIDFDVVLFGYISDKYLQKINKKYTSYGYITDDHKLRLLYSAADLFIAPSKIEAFGKTIVESLACGTPVVAYNTTGPKEIILHKKNGYLAEQNIYGSLADGIQWVLKNKGRTDLVDTCREWATNNYSKKIIAQKYKKLYESILMR